jgi:hypothetical protein
MTTPAITYENVFASILSMDAYNRTVNQGVFLANAGPNDAAPNTPIGDYTILGSDIDSDTGFYAVAYKHNTTGEIVISYRGTDDLGEGKLDALFGFPIGAGFTINNQMKQAIDFYNTVIQLIPGFSTTTIFSPTQPTNLTLTGHSLGGGLAGAVASVAGVKAEIIDAMALSKAA